MTDKEKISELKNLVEILCDNVSDQPSGCDACWLWENGNCGKEVLYEKMKAENQKPCDKYIKEIDHLRRYISKLETQIVEQEPKTGHWKHNKCDMCGASRPPLFDNYCPNCGAYMKSGNNEE